MSDIQRYSAYHSGDPSQIGLWDDNDGHWVTYADHVEALRQAEQRGREQVHAAMRSEKVVAEVGSMLDDAYVKGQRDALAGAVQRARVEMRECGIHEQRIESALAAIKGDDR